MSVYYLAGIPFSDDLYHHGIKGQKWGVRRYQNEDRSLTPAGLERYRSPNGAKPGSSHEVAKKVGKAAAIGLGVGLAAYGAYKLGNSSYGRDLISKGSERIRETGLKRNVNNQRVRDAALAFKLSDDELMERIGRLTKEAQLRKLTYESLTSSAEPRNQIMMNAGKKVAETALAGAGLYAIKALATRRIDPKDAAGYIAPKPKTK